MKQSPIFLALSNRPQRGEPFIIAKAGKPLVKVVALDAPTGDQMRRLGFMKGKIAILTILIKWAPPKLTVFQ